jgi:hypothetical protein
MSESDANRAMNDTARMRLQPDPLEDTQRMPVADRRYRQADARYLHAHPQILRGWQWREPFERPAMTQTEIYEQCFAADRASRKRARES